LSQVIFVLKLPAEYFCSVKFIISQAYESKQAMYVIKITLSFIVILNLTYVSLAQNIDSTKLASYFGGAVKLTNNGISTIPNLSLGKPAAIFSMSMGRKIRFEPEFRFALEGKPWSFIFWWRYELLNTDKFRIRTLEKLMSLTTFGRSKLTIYSRS
jgi:hypothetical protein